MPYHQVLVLVQLYGVMAGYRIITHFAEAMAVFYFHYTARPQHFERPADARCEPKWSVRPADHSAGRIRCDPMPLRGLVHTALRRRPRRRLSARAFPCAVLRLRTGSQDRS